jgi:hypothetical protein
MLPRSRTDSCPPRVLEEVQVAIHDRSRSETPSPVGACDRLSTWLCNTMTDATHASADEDNVKEMRRKLEEVMAEFDVRRFDPLAIGPVLMSRPLLSGGCAHAD